MWVAATHFSLRRVAVPQLVDACFSRVCTRRSSRWATHPRLRTDPRRSIFSELVHVQSFRDCFAFVGSGVRALVSHVVPSDDVSRLYNHSEQLLLYFTRATSFANKAAYVYYSLGLRHALIDPHFYLLHSIKPQEKSCLESICGTCWFWWHGS